MACATGLEGRPGGAGPGMLLFVVAARTSLAKVTLLTEGSKSRDVASTDLRASQQGGRGQGGAAARLTGSQSRRRGSLRRGSRGSWRPCDGWLRGSRPANPCGRRGPLPRRRAHGERRMPFATWRIAGASRAFLCATRARRHNWGCRTVSQASLFKQALRAQWRMTRLTSAPCPWQTGRWRPSTHSRGRPFRRLCRLAACRHTDAGRRVSDLLACFSLSSLTLTLAERPIGGCRQHQTSRSRQKKTGSASSDSHREHADTGRETLSRGLREKLVRRGMAHEPNRRVGETVGPSLVGAAAARSRGGKGPSAGIERTVLACRAPVTRVCELPTMGIGVRVCACTKVDGRTDGWTDGRMDGWTGDRYEVAWLDGMGSRQ